MTKIGFKNQQKITNNKNICNNETKEILEHDVIGQKEIYNGSGLTLGDLRNIINECNDCGMPDYIPIHIAQHKDSITSNAMHIVADLDSINFYDWI